MRRPYAQRLLLLSAAPATDRRAASSRIKLVVPRHRLIFRKACWRAPKKNQKTENPKKQFVSHLFCLSVSCLSVVCVRSMCDHPSLASIEFIKFKVLRPPYRLFVILDLGESLVEGSFSGRKRLVAARGAKPWKVSPVREEGDQRAKN